MLKTRVTYEHGLKVTRVLPSKGTNGVCKERKGMESSVSTGRKYEGIESSISTGTCLSVTKSPVPSRVPGKLVSVQ